MRTMTPTAMSSFLQRMVWKGDDHDIHGIAVGDEVDSGDRGGTKGAFAMPVWLRKRSNSSKEIPPGVTRNPSRPSTLELLGNSKHSAPGTVHRGGSDPRGLKTPTTHHLVEEVVRDFEETYKSPSEKTSSTPRSKNFVKRLVAALERRQCNSDVGEQFLTTYDNGPILAYEPSGTIRRSESEPVYSYHHHCSTESVRSPDDELRVETAGHEEKVDEDNYTTPRIVGAFLKKPIEIGDTSIYWIPITGKKLPRKRSFKRLLSKLTGNKKSEFKRKQVVFASQENLVEDIHDSGYDERSSSSNSLLSINEEIIFPGAGYLEPLPMNNNFSTFLTSSPLRKPDEQKPVTKDKSKTLTKLFPNELAISSSETVDDSGYASNFSTLEETTERADVTASKVKQIAQQLSMLPNHPWSRTEPRPTKPIKKDSPLADELVEVRRIREELTYDVPRPRSSIPEEVLALKRRDLDLPVVTGSGYPTFADDDEPHYATVKSRNNMTSLNYGNLNPFIVETTGGYIDEGIGEPEKMSTKTHGKRRGLSSSFGDLRANESFVITMYV